MNHGSTTPVDAEYTTSVIHGYQAEYESRQTWIVNDGAVDSSAFLTLRNCLVQTAYASWKMSVNKFVQRNC